MGSIVVKPSSQLLGVGVAVGGLATDGSGDCDAGEAAVGRKLAMGSATTTAIRQSSSERRSKPGRTEICLFPLAISATAMTEMENGKKLGRWLVGGRVADDSGSGGALARLLELRT